MRMWHKILLGISIVLSAFILASAAVFWLSVIDQWRKVTTTRVDNSAVPVGPQAGNVPSPRMVAPVSPSRDADAPRLVAPAPTGDATSAGTTAPVSRSRDADAPKVVAPAPTGDATSAATTAPVSRSRDADAPKLVAPAPPGDAVSPGLSATAVPPEPSTQRPLPIDSPAVEEISSDLLRIEDATTIQRRLAELGFLGSPLNGIWTPRSRQALREFKAANALPRDDVWDRQTKTRLFDSDAKKMTGPRLAANEPNTDLDTSYPPPPGTTLNPLNNAEAVTLQKRLAELGFFLGKIDGVWGLASRNALQDFKTMNGLTADDQWDAVTEGALKAERPVRAAETFVGVWAEEAADCKPTNAGGAPLRISVRQAEKSGTVCKFGPALREGSTWGLQAVCTGEGKTWNANVRLSVSGDQLTWSSERGTDSFVRCGGL